jgi:hypothetical protein
MSRPGHDGGPESPPNPPRSRHDGGSESPPRIDPEAMLVALVLAPATYSRNRFFHLYEDPAVRRVRRRASQIRSIVRHMARVDPRAAGEVLGAEPAAGGRVALSYVVPAIGLRRTALLDPIELSLVRVAMGRAGLRLHGGERADLPADDADRARIDAVLARLAPGVALV